MLKRLIQILIAAVTLVTVGACSDDSEPGDVCESLNPPPSCLANNTNNTNNTNNSNNAQCEPECSGATPVCLEGACVECAEGGDCESGVCDEDTNVCTGCVDNAECMGETPRCDDGVCVACDTASDEGCEGGAPFCETVDGTTTCVACDSPGFTGDCPAGTTCNDAYVCSACESNTECTDADASVCDSAGTSSSACVACTEASDCSHIAGATQCDGGTCVECTAATSDSDCTQADASVCDTSGAEPVCAGCSEASECSHIAGANHCIGDTCVECEILTEAADCNGNFCDENNTCSTTPVGSASGCQACAADTDCEGGHRCIALDFQGTFHGNYCMPVPDTSASPVCPEPYGAGDEARTTVDEQTLDVCLIEEGLTTCEAVDVFKKLCSPGFAD